MRQINSILRDLGGKLQSQQSDSKCDSSYKLQSTVGVNSSVGFVLTISDYLLVEKIHQ